MDFVLPSECERYRWTNARFEPTGITLVVRSSMGNTVGRMVQCSYCIALKSWQICSDSNTVCAHIPCTHKRARRAHAHTIFRGHIHRRQSLTMFSVKLCSCILINIYIVENVSANGGKQKAKQLFNRNVQQRIASEKLIFRTHCLQITNVIIETVNEFIIVAGSYSLVLHSSLSL